MPGTASPIFASAGQLLEVKIMTRLTVDGITLAVLSQAKELIEICDASGKVIGFFAPSSLKNAGAYARAAARIDRAELERRKYSNEKGIPHAEVMAGLKALEAECDRREAAGEPKMTDDEAVEFVRSLRKKEGE
jgi:hypothetical protein